MVGGVVYADDSANLELSKSADPGTAIVGELLTYTLAVYNQGPSDATSVTVTDTLPVSVTYTASSPECEYDDVQHIVTCTLGTLSQGWEWGRQLTITVVPSETGQIRNEAEVWGDEPDPNEGNNTSSVETQVYEAGTAPQLSIDKSVLPDTAVAYHGLVTYTLVLTNDGPADAVGVLLTDTLPVEVDFDHWVVQPAGADVTDDQVTWTGTVTGYDAVTFVFVASHVGDYGDVVLNTAEYEHSTGSGSADATFTVIGVSGLVVVKKANTASAQVGQTLTYTYRITNTGDVALMNLIAVDNKLGPVPLTVTTLAPGEWIIGTLTYTVVEADLPGPLTNTVTVTGSSPLGAEVTATARESVTLFAEEEPIRVFLPFVSISIKEPIHLFLPLIFKGYAP